MNSLTYTIALFAHNEASNLTATLRSVKAGSDFGLIRLTVLANGCTDQTAKVARELGAKLSLPSLEVVEIELGDKCNAWNHYVHDLAPRADCHFFVDADVDFTAACFPALAARLLHCAPEANVVAGLPLSGRNGAFYRSLVKERSCFFGNLYGISPNYLNLLRARQFRLPVGLNWIDSFLTKAANTDLGFGRDNLPNRVTWLEDVGFHVRSLSPLRPSDIKLYRNRIARYELGKIQERYLDQLPVCDWPADMKGINRDIQVNFYQQTAHLDIIRRWLVRDRLRRLLQGHRSHA